MIKRSYYILTAIIISFLYINVTLGSTSTIYLYNNCQLEGNIPTIIHVLLTAPLKPYGPCTLNGNPSVDVDHIRPGERRKLSSADCQQPPPSNKWCTYTYLVETGFGGGYRSANGDIDLQAYECKPEVLIKTCPKDPKEWGAE